MTPEMEELLNLAAWIEREFHLGAGSKVHPTRESEKIYQHILERLEALATGNL